MNKRTWYLPVVHCASLTALFMKIHMAFPLLGLVLDPGDLAHSLSHLPHPFALSVSQPLFRSHIPPFRHLSKSSKDVPE